MDVVFIASNPHLVALRPVLVYFFRRLCHDMNAFARSRLGNAINVWNVWPLGAAMSLLTALTAAQCRDWVGLLTFIAMDWFDFSSKLWAPTKAGNRWAVLRGFRWFLKCTKPVPPFGHRDTRFLATAFRYYELLVETTTMTAGFLTVLLVYPASLRLPHAMLTELYFPAGLRSFYFVLVMGVSDLVQDGVAQNACAVLTPHRPLEHPFARSNRMIFLSQFGVSLWAVLYMTNLGWFFKTAEVGPWLPAGGP